MSCGKEGRRQGTQAGQDEQPLCYACWHQGMARRAQAHRVGQWGMRASLLIGSRCAALCPWHSLAHHQYNDAQYPSLRQAVKLAAACSGRSGAV